MSKLKPKQDQPTAGSATRTIKLTIQFDEERDADVLIILDGASKGKKWETLMALHRLRNGDNTQA